MSEEEQEFLTNLYRMYRSDMLRYAFAFMKDWKNAEVVVQTVFARLLDKVLLLMAMEMPKLDAYVKRSIKYEAYRELEKQQKRPLSLFSEDLHHLEDLDSDTAMQALRNVERAELLDIVRSLKPIDQDILVLDYYCGLSHKEIARMMGTQEKNISVRKHRAIRQLRKLYEKLGGFGGH